uniref:PLP-dependent transferase n=1 Tax=candidate division CPR3 bacterium TaxID=2268181 RepID=A0A7C4R8F6_UNCC3
MKSAEILNLSLEDLKDDFDELEVIVFYTLEKLCNFYYLIESLKKYSRLETLNTALENTRYFEKKFLNLSTKISKIKAYLKKKKPTLEVVNEIQETKEKYFEEIRTQIHTIASIITSLDWQSPSFSHSIYTMAGKYTGKIIGTINDYKRDGRLDNQILEKWYLKQYIDAKFKFNIHVYATNSGMAAFSTILNFLIMEKKAENNVLIGKNIYHENKKLITKCFSDKLFMVNELETDKIIELIKQKKPSLIFFDSLCNTKNIPVPQLSKIIDFLTYRYPHNIYLIIDNTCLSTTFQPFKMVQGKNRKLRLIVFESLIKYLQFGLDRVNAGIITAYGKDTEKIMDYREHLGTNINDIAVYTIPQISRKIYENRLKRLSRNAYLLSSLLQTYIANNKTLIRQIIYPMLENHPAYPWAIKMPFGGSFLNLDFQKPNIKIYKKFIDLTVKKAAKRKVNISGGTSFGFNSSRIYLTALRIGNTEPFVRISVGTETYLQVIKLKEIFLEVINDLSRFKLF